VYDNTELTAARIKRLSFSNRKSSPANHLKPFVIKLAPNSSTKARAHIHFYRPTRPRHGNNLKPAKGHWSLHCARSVKPTTQKPLSLAAAFTIAHELQYILYYLL